MLRPSSELWLRHGGCCDGPTRGHGRPVGGDRTADSETAPSPQGRAAAGQRSPGVNRDFVCAEDRHSVGVSAAGDGLRQRDDVLAAAARLAAGRRLGEAAPPIARPAAGSRPTRLVAGGGGQRQHPGGRGGEKTGPNPTDRRKKGSKHHVITDAQGIPLAARLTSANTNDGTQLLPLVDAIPPIAGKPGAPRRRPDAVYGDRAYYSYLRRMLLYIRGIEPFLAKPREPHGSGLGRQRWVVERTLSWLHQFRRLRVRYERRADIHEGFLSLGCALICWKHVMQRFC